MEEQALVAEAAPESQTPPQAPTETTPSMGPWVVAAAAASAVVVAGCPPQPQFQPVDPHPGGPLPDMPATLRKLVERITFGINRFEADMALSLGYDDYLEYHLNPMTIDDTALEDRISGFRSLTMSPKQLADRIFSGDFSSIEEFYEATYLRSAYSRRQLFERMVAFWTNHFSIHFEKNFENILKPVDDREVIRANALGNFKTLLSASAHSPAMLHYLDNDASTAAIPNQNYARELMELHTLGPDNYSQFDIEEVARCLTGWSINIDLSSPEAGRFLFIPIIHDFGEKTVLGHTIEAGDGISDGETVLDILTSDATYGPITAQFIARKLAVEFWGYDPPQQLVDEIAQAYLATSGDIKAMLRACLAESWVAQATPKLKRPYHLMTSAMRLRPSNIKNPWGVVNHLKTLGHQPYQWVTPDGYPDEAAYWGEFVLARWNFTTFFGHQDWSTQFDWDPFLQEGITLDAFVDLVDAHFFGNTLGTDERHAVRSFMEPSLNNMWRRRQAIGLALSMDSFQWY